MPHQHVGKITSKKAESLDKIFKVLNEKISEDYISLREELNDTLREKLESNYEFKKIMEKKLSGNRRQISELFEIVERTKRGIFEEITGMEVPKTKLEIQEGGGLFNEYEANYDGNKNLIKIYSKPSLSFLNSRKKNNQDILNSFIHELTHQEQTRFVENREDIIVQGIKDQADIFYINDRIYLTDVSLKKYRRQPVEEEAFAAGDKLSKDLAKEVNKKREKKTTKKNEVTQDKERPLPKIPRSKEKAGSPEKLKKTSLIERLKKPFSKEVSEKVTKKESSEKEIDSVEKRLKNIAERAESLPKEHLIDALVSLSKKDKDLAELVQYSRALRETKGAKILDHQTMGPLTESKNKSLDKIFKALNGKISEEYKDVKEKLDSSLVKKLESNEEFKKLMKEKLTGNEDKVKKLFNMVEEAKYESFKEVTGFDTPRAILELKEGGEFKMIQGTYSDNKVQMNKKPILSFLRSKKANNEEILNTLIHELTHQDQERFRNLKGEELLKGVKEQAEIFDINENSYIESKEGGKYKRQPLEKEAFETGEKLTKELMKNVKESKEKLTVTSTKFKGPGKNRKKIEKTDSELVKKLEIISKEADKLPTEHLLLKLEEIGTGMTNDDYQKLLKEHAKYPDRKILIPETLKVTSEKEKKALDKIYQILNSRMSEDYKALRKDLDNKLVSKLESNPEFKELMKKKLVGNKARLEKLFGMVEEAKYESFKEVTGLETSRAIVELKSGGKLKSVQGSYLNGLVKLNESPKGSFLRTRKANNEEILNTFIHELTHQDQDKIADNREEKSLDKVQTEARLFNINNKVYIDFDLRGEKRYGRQPIEKEAFETGDKLSKELMKKN